jgi:hypothetical protein
VLIDEFGNGGCTGIEVAVQWTAHTPTVFDHTSTQQSGHGLSSWITPSTPSALTRQFVCCTYPVEASFATQPGDALGYTFINTTSGGGTASWSINGVPLYGDTVEFSFPTPGTYEVCLTVQGVCAVDTECQEVAVASTGIDGPDAADLLRVWPQPATEVLHIAYEAAVERIEIIDAAGRLLRALTALGRQRIDVDIRAFAPGAYVLRAWSHEGAVRRVWIKQ